MGIRRRRPPALWQDEYAAYQLRLLNHSANSVRSYVWGMNVVISYTGKPIWEINADDLIAFMLDSDRPAKTLGLIISAVKSGHRWAAATGRCKLNGVMAVQAPKTPKQKRKPPCSADTARKILAASSSDPLEARVAYLTFFEGCRIDEAGNMRPHHVSQSGDRFTFIGKGNREREVPMHPEVEPMLDFIFSREVSTAWLHKVVNRLVLRTRALTVTGTIPTAHDFRRTFGDTLYNDFGAKREIVKELLGHELDVTDRYVEIRFSSKREVVHALHYGHEPVQLQMF